jgi:hypothetical protein
VPERNKQVFRIGDMNRCVALAVVQQDDGDFIVSIGQVGRMVLPIVGSAKDPHLPHKAEDDRTASVEYCASGGQSPRVRAALRVLQEAIELDNAERPIAPPK